MSDCCKKYLMTRTEGVKTDLVYTNENLRLLSQTTLKLRKDTNLFSLRHYKGTQLL
jgi:hypothetical protein